LPIRFILGAGQQNDMAPACDLIRGIPAGKVLADRAYDADSLHDLIYEQGGEPVIPPRRHRKYQHRYDRIAYKQRWGIEGFFAKLKQWRRIATRYDKLAANFLGFVKLASIMLWLKRLNRHHSLAGSERVRRHPRCRARPAPSCSVSWDPDSGLAFKASRACQSQTDQILFPDHWILFPVS
jgi:transposase